MIHIGGGFGVPYHKLSGQARLDLARLGRELSKMLRRFFSAYGKEISIHIEPGRYIVAECGVLLGTVHALKDNYGEHYAGTDLGFNTLMRPVLYGSHHDLEVHRRLGSGLGGDDQEHPDGENRRVSINPRTEKVTVVGNICETGDILAAGQELPSLGEGDLLCVLDAGAYGYAMASNYNCRLRPAEVLIGENGDVMLIRRRETFEDLLRSQQFPHLLTSL